MDPYATTLMEDPTAMGAYGAFVESSAAEDSEYMARTSDLYGAMVLEGECRDTSTIMEYRVAAVADSPFYFSDPVEGLSPVGVVSYASMISTPEDDSADASGPSKTSAVAKDSPSAQTHAGEMSLLHAQDLFFLNAQARKTVTITSQWEHNWTQKFLQLLAMDDSEEKFTFLGQLAKDFDYAAQVYGQVIINELCLDVESKSIKPVDVGGIAGGTKYIQAGILFKFALDFEGLYGSDEAAMKAACHELRGVIYVHEMNLPNLHTPLMALVDYKGFRLIAISLLDINKSTIVYGSSNGGVTVHDDDAELSKLVQRLGSKLNLKRHKVTDKFLYTCGDIEIHRAMSGRFYVVDAARLFPPEAQLPGHRPHSRGEWLYNLLRPELVKSFRSPLSSDAFSMFQRYDEDWRRHNEDVSPPLATNLRVF